jgi:hypothetical protein
VNLSIHTAPVSLALGTLRYQADAGRHPVPPSFLVGSHSPIIPFDFSNLVKVYFTRIVDFPTSTGPEADR